MGTGTHGGRVRERRRKNGSTPSDVDLIQQARTDPNAFAALYERYVNRIYAYFYYRTGSHDDAEELTSRFFYRLIERIHLFEDRGVPVSAWMFRIAHNMLANWMRDRSRRQEVPLEVAGNGYHQRDHPEDMVVAREEQEMLLQVIQQLPPERQLLLYLKFVEGMPHAEIGKVLGRTEGAVKSLYHRTLVSLRRLLTQRVNSKGEI